LQKQLIELDKSIRGIEKKKTDCASKTVSISNRILYVKACFARARAYKDILSENATVLEQLREHITSRMEQYRKSGNLFDIVEYVQLGEELKETKETFDKNFEQSYPLLQEVEKAYRDLAKNNYADNVNSERNSRDEDIFRKALQAREEVMKMEV
jgi:chaperonin cofactor prefoldin